MFFLRRGLDSRGDDGAVRILTDFLGTKGFNILGAHDFIESTYDKGVLGSVKPTQSDQKIYCSWC